jgi:hypothetical protein
MVCAMGLLDDAIREHLELKRRAGADPSEVARQQREALAPVGGAGEPAWENEAGVAEHEQAATDAAADEHPTEAHEQLAPAEDDVAPGVQETEEIDMQTVLAEDGAPPVDAGAVDHGLTTSAPTEMDADHELEWDEPAPAADDDDMPREIPGQERMSFE